MPMDKKETNKNSQYKTSVDRYLEALEKEKSIDVCVNNCSYVTLEQRDIRDIKTTVRVVRSLLLGEESNITADFNTVERLFDDNAVKAALADGSNILNASAEEISALLNIFSHIDCLCFAIHNFLPEIDEIIEHTGEITGTSMPENPVAISSNCFNTIATVMAASPLGAEESFGILRFDPDVILDRLMIYSYYDGEKVYICPQSLYGCWDFLILFNRMIHVKLELH